MRSLILITVLGGLCGLSWAQTAAPVPATGGADAVSDSAEIQPSNYIRWSVRATGDFDDNALNSATAPTENEAASIQPGVSWNMTRPRWKWTLDYRPSLYYSANLSGYSLQSHDVGTEFQTRLSKRLSLTLRNGFDFSSNPFDWLQQSSSVGAPVATQGVNSTLLGGSARRTSDSGGGDVVYALAKHSSLGIGGAYSTLMFEPLAGTTGTAIGQDQQAVSAHAFYSRQFSRRQWTGLQFTYQHVNSLSGAQETQVGSAVYSHTVAITPKLVVSGFAGPEYTRTNLAAYFLATAAPGVQREQSSWTWTAGGNVSWNSSHMNVGGGFNQQISDGAGFLGAVQLSALTANVSHKLSRSSSVRVEVSYNVNRPLTKGAMLPELDYFSIAATYSRHLSEHIALDATYWRAQQSVPAGAALGLVADHNRASVGISYEFSRPIGR